jgi:GGDEF domain-containing protein
MSMKDARKYISDLHKKQGNPYLWPDFVTGLPNTSAIIKKTNEAYPKLGRLSISYIRIGNIHPYLIKYGTNRHSEIIQWTAAILKTAVEKHKGFVGVLGSYDFVTVCNAKKTEECMKEAFRLFEKKIKTFYSEQDLKKKSVFSFKRDGETITLGLMKLIAASVDRPTRIAKKNIINHLAERCSEMENE